MMDFDSIDFSALTVFMLIWIAYDRLINRDNPDQESANQKINHFIEAWMRQVGGIENRISDVLINLSIQNGSAYFASASLIALAGVLTLAQYADQATTFMHSIHDAVHINPFIWQIKAVGLALIIAYAFFQFSWSYVLFSYTATLMGAIVPPDADEEDVERSTRRCAVMCIEAGGNFTQGLQASFFALAYLGWFIGPYVLIVTTMIAVCVMWRRQFASDAYRAVK